jgi:hypothetical protein
VNFEAPHPKREIPQCMRCQKYGDTKNYCRNTPRRVKCAAHHLTSECPRKVQDGNVRCLNCNEPHPANYRECVVHKQLQQKIYSKLRERHVITSCIYTVTTRPIQNGVTYAQVVQGQPNIPQPNATPPHPTHMPQPGNNLTELKQMMKNLMDQMSTLINLMSALVSKTN